ncbi:MAG: tRNA-specific adenosine deaminase [Lentisphaerae bacterium ADurb.Bin242]|nr:MAG: tRNA-specific adenosine deaminase [Lentisphaerae bacterium ADurb.Bin242]
MKSGKKNCPAKNEMPEIFNDEYFMRAALREAGKAERDNEVPIGAVAVKDGMVIARAWNQVELLKDATAHAEILVLTAASSALGDWRMDGVTIYVTKEPCAMCAGAMVNARVERVVFGLRDPRCGACGSALNVTSFPGMLHRVEVLGGVLELECGEQIRQFFRKVRSGLVPGNKAVETISGDE